MKEIVQVEEVLDETINDDGVDDRKSSSSLSMADADRESDEKETSSTSTDEASLTGTALLKSLLSTSTASSVAVAEKMITTTEVTDETLNLKKILYQPDKQKKDDKEQNGGHLANTSDPLNDDDDRLVIDISDEEKDANADGKTNGKSMPSLAFPKDFEKRVHQRQPGSLETAPIKLLARHISRFHENDLPKSITYCLEPSLTTGISSSFKIDILETTLNHLDSTTEKGSRVASYQSPSKCSKTMSSLDELNVISHEIDKQITKKTNAILELLKEFLSGTLEKVNFMTRMTDASDTSLSDLLSVARKLTKRHKFEPNPNHKEFMRIKFLLFPTTSKDLVSYFDNLLPSLNKDKFISMIKFYEIIIKEMLNLNKTKILQYLIDFMVMRKNAQLDLLNYNYQVTSAPNLKQATTSASKFQLADSTQNMNERKASKLHDTTYNFIIRSDPIYLQAGSSFATNHRDVITCRMSPRIQMRSFERRPFDNNVLKGRRIGRRLVRSPEDDKVQIDLLRARFPLTPQSEPGTPVHPLAIIPQASTPIIVDSDTPPPSLPSEPLSPPQHRVMKVQPRPVMFVQQVKALEKMSNENPNTLTQHENVNTLKRRASVRSVDQATAQSMTDPLQNGQITIQEIQTLNQNGTEIIPTSILKHTILNRRKTIEKDRSPNKASENGLEVKKFYPRAVSLEDKEKPSPSIIKSLPKRRQSCHERIMMPVSESEEKTIENSAIGRNYMEFLHAYEKELKKTTRQHEMQQELQQQQQRPLQLTFAHNPHPQPLHLQQKRVRFSEVEEGPSSRNHLQDQVNYAASQQQQMEHRQRFPPLQFLPGSPMRSPIKPHPPAHINYQFYQNQFERELRERGFDHRVDNHQEPNRPLELVSHIPPERYHQHEQQRAHYANQLATKQVRQEQVPPQVQHRSSQMHTAMMTAAYQQLQSLHRDSTPQQYAEHLKQLDRLKQLPPSAFTAYHREHRAPQPDYYPNTQEVHEKVSQTSPHHYQISSSSSRENSPTNYEIGKQDESLQRKMKNKAKSSTYIEPNQLAKPFFNPAHSTYYSEPYALKKPVSAVPKSPQETAKPAAYHPSEPQRPRSPVTRNFVDQNESSKQYQWLVAHAHAHTLAMQNFGQPQRPIPRPPVPAFIETKTNGVSQLRPIPFPDQPTEFLRNYYANPKNF